MEKQLAMFLLKVWGTTILLAPFEFTLALKSHLTNSHQPILEIVLNIAIPIFLGFLYFTPSLIMALIAAFISIKLQKRWTVIKLISNVSLFLFMGIQLYFIYQNNLSLIYKGTGMMVVCYVITLVITSAALYRSTVGEQAI